MDPGRPTRKQQHDYVLPQSSPNAFYIAHCKIYPLSLMVMGSDLSSLMASCLRRFPSPLICMMVTHLPSPPRASGRAPNSVVLIGHLFLATVMYYLAVYILPKLPSPDDLVVAEALVGFVFCVHIYFLEVLTVSYRIPRQLLCFWQIWYVLTMAEKVLPPTHYRVGMTNVVLGLVFVRMMFALLLGLNPRFFDHGFRFDAGRQHLLRVRAVGF